MSEHYEHKREHEQLHEAVLKLAGDFMTHTGKRLRKTSMFDFIRWSYEQTQDPTEFLDGDDD